MRNLSKSKIIAFRQCPKRLWLEIHKPELRDDSASEAVFKIGHQVGDIARSIYDPEGTGETIDINHGRKHLSAWLSDDDGKTWQGGLMLDERDGVSYPDGFQSIDGTIYISYDHNRSTDGEILMARFTEDDVLAKKLVGAKSKLKMLISRPMKPKTPTSPAR